MGGCHGNEDMERERGRLLGMAVMDVTFRCSQNSHLLHISIPCTDDPLQRRSDEWIVDGRHNNE